MLYEDDDGGDDDYSSYPHADDLADDVDTTAAASFVAYLDSADVIDDIAASVADTTTLGFIDVTIAAYFAIALDPSDAFDVTCAYFVKNTTHGLAGPILLNFH